MTDIAGYGALLSGVAGLGRSSRRGQRKAAHEHASGEGTLRELLSGALKILDLGTPLIWAAPVFGLFRFLDRNASAKAKKAISMAR